MVIVNQLNKKEKKNANAYSISEHQIGFFIKTMDYDIVVKRRIRKQIQTIPM